MSGSNKFLVPGAIVVAALLIAGAVFVANRGTSDNPNTPKDESPSGNVEINPITESDHILGNPNAPIKIVEYSDIDCPFCSQFHDTMNQIVDEYGPSGQVAWVFRHFPLPQLHPDATLKAEASECVADLAGNSAFWGYMDRLFEREDETRADLALIAREVGVNTNEFNECLNGNEFEDDVQEDAADARRAGGQGTPHSIIVIEETGERVPLQGAQPYESVKQIIDTILPADSAATAPQTGTSTDTQ